MTYTNRKYYVFEHIVTFSETNLVGNVYFSHYAAWQGACREHFLLEYAPSVIHDLASGRLALVTVHLELNFISECYAGDTIEIRMSRGTGPMIAANRVKMEFDYVRSGTTVAVGMQTVACMRRTSAGEYESCLLPDEFIEALGEFSDL